MYVYIYIYIYTHVYVCIYIYIYIYTCTRTCTYAYNYKYTLRTIIGSVWFVSAIHFPVRCGSACVFRTCHGLVRFGSASGSGRFRPVPELNGSVRFGSAGSVGFRIPSCQCCGLGFRARSVHDLGPLCDSNFMPSESHRVLECKGSGVSLIM